MSSLSTGDQTIKVLLYYNMKVTSPKIYFLETWMTYLTRLISINSLIKRK